MLEANQDLLLPRGGVSLAAQILLVQLLQKRIPVSASSRRPRQRSPERPGQDEIILIDPALSDSWGCLCTGRSSFSGFSSFHGGEGKRSDIGCRESRMQEKKVWLE